MELLRNDDFYVLKDGKRTLWLSRHDTTLFARTDQLQVADLVCIGRVCGLIGKLKVDRDSAIGGLLLIREQSILGGFPGGHVVCKINKVAYLPLDASSDQLEDFDIDVCQFHPDTHYKLVGADLLQQTIRKTVNSGKTTVDQIKNKKSKLREQEQLSKRILKEVYRLFNDSDSFYYSPSLDLTSRLQHQYSSAKAASCRLEPATEIGQAESGQAECGQQGECGQQCVDTASADDQAEYDSSLPMWRRADRRFFWNYAMLQDLIQLAENGHDEINDWIVPIIHGCVLSGQVPDDEPSSVVEQTLRMSELKSKAESAVDYINGETSHQSGGTAGSGADDGQQSAGQQDVGPGRTVFHLISRRSRFRAGTRFNRRGIDRDGSCANYVETEQIVEVGDHVTSLVQIRGSVPLFWSQRTNRAPPRLDTDKGLAQSAEAFNKHIAKQLVFYGSPLVCINLVDQAGREKALGDAFLDQCAAYDCPRLCYFSFDFHQRCRNFQYRNISILTKHLANTMRQMAYFWLYRGEQVMSEQKGVFRVNCVDCLDRTNVVQSAIARCFVQTQLQKLGVLSPEEHLSSGHRRVLAQMWADNGDVISRQYAGTDALKGDYTRTGQRNIAGMMKDSVNWANRYYQNRFRDVYRQMAIDALTGELKKWSKNENVIARLEKRMSFKNDGNNPTATKTAATDSADESSGGASSSSEAEDEVDDDADDCSIELQKRRKEEQLRRLFDDCRQFFLRDDEQPLAMWPLIEVIGPGSIPHEGNGNDDGDLDTILMLTTKRYYAVRVAQLTSLGAPRPTEDSSVDSPMNKFSLCVPVDLANVERVEIGLKPWMSGGALPFMIGRQAEVRRARLAALHKQQAVEVAADGKPLETDEPPQVLPDYCIRLWFRCCGTSGYHHVFRPPGYRLFNNVIIPLQSTADSKEALEIIANMFAMIYHNQMDAELPVSSVLRLDRKRSKPLQHALQTATNAGRAGLPFGPGLGTRLRAFKQKLVSPIGAAVSSVTGAASHSRSVFYTPEETSSNSVGSANDGPISHPSPRVLLNSAAVPSQKPPLELRNSLSDGAIAETAAALQVDETATSPPEAHSSSGPSNGADLSVPLDTATSILTSVLNISPNLRRRPETSAPAFSTFSAGGNADQMTVADEVEREKRILDSRSKIVLL